MAQVVEPACVDGDVLTYMTRAPQNDADAIKKEFRLGSKEKGGMLNFEELESLLAEGGEVGVAKQLYDCMVKDRDGRISFDEFVDFIYSQRTMTAQARFGCQSRMTSEMRGFEPHSFPLPWSGLRDAIDEDEDGSTAPCSFDEFYAWLSCTDMTIGAADVDFAQAQQLVDELKKKYVKGDKEGALDFYTQNSENINLGVRPATGESYLASKETLRDLQQHVMSMPGQAGWIGDDHTEGLQCGEILQDALVAKLAAKGAVRVTPRLIQSLHQVVTCGRRLPSWRQDGGSLYQLGTRRHHAPPASALPTLVVLYCMQTEAALSSWKPHDAAAFALWWILHLQPFSDGNGRTSRGLALAVLRLRGLAPSAKNFHEMLKEQKMRQRLAVCLGETTTIVGCCQVIPEDVGVKQLGVKPKAFASLSLLLQEIV